MMLNFFSCTYWQGLLTPSSLMRKLRPRAVKWIIPHSAVRGSFFLPVPPCHVHGRQGSLSRSAPRWGLWFVWVSFCCCHHPPEILLGLLVAQDFPTEGIVALPESGTQASQLSKQRIPESQGWQDPVRASSSNPYHSERETEVLRRWGTVWGLTGRWWWSCGQGRTLPDVHMMEELGEHSSLYPLLQQGSAQQGCLEGEGQAPAGCLSA